MGRGKKRKKPSPEQLAKYSADFEYSLNIASECLAGHMGSGDSVGVDMHDGVTWFKRIESLLDASDPVNAEMFANQQALILFFNGLTAHAVQRSIEVGISEDTAENNHNDVGAIVVKAMCDARPKNLSSIGKRRLSDILELAQTGAIFALHDRKDT